MSHVTALDDEMRDDEVLSPCFASLLVRYDDAEASPQPVSISRGDQKRHDDMSYEASAASNDEREKASLTTLLTIFLY